MKFAEILRGTENPLDVYAGERGRTSLREKPECNLPDQ